MDNNFDGITHPMDEPLLSSVRDFEVLVESTMWKDIEATIRDRIEILTDDLIKTRDDKEIYRLQASIEVWREMLALPHYLTEHAKIEQKLKDERDASRD